MRQKITLLLFLICICVSTHTIGQTNSKEKKFSTTINKLLDALNNKDEKEINQFIQPEYGVVILYKIGIPIAISKVKRIEIDKPIMHFVLYEGVDCTIRKVNYESLPEFNSDTESWSKSEGIYCDTATVNRLYSESARFLIDYEHVTHLKDEYPAILKLENITRRVVIRGKDKYDTLIVHLSYIKGKWYFTLYDKATEDRSA